MGLAPTRQANGQDGMNFKMIFHPRGVNGKTQQCRCEAGILVHRVQLSEKTHYSCIWLVPFHRLHTLPFLSLLVTDPVSNLNFIERVHYNSFD